LTNKDAFEILAKRMDDREANIDAMLKLDNVKTVEEVRKQKGVIDYQENGSWRKRPAIIQRLKKAARIMAKNENKKR
jgi:hypothetical protein